MRYPDVVRGTFLRRHNRFLAEVLLDGEATPVHVKNTGRLAELLLPGAEVYLSAARSAGRKTAWDLFCVRSGRELVNIDSQAPNQVFAQWVREGGFPGLTLLRPETTFGASRFDFYLQAGPRRRFVEVKGVTLLCEDGLMRFPDAPTTRGTKHLLELAACMEEGFEAQLCFVVTRRCPGAVAPHEARDPAFCAALRRAAERGVEITAIDCIVTEDGLEPAGPVPVVL